ncbi:AAA family ATPase [Burkholderia stagnalis]|uniref:AAA family ATPase n=1 Tax=Burkholderia stagnalis TaxID=1503054 RepID=UPI0009BCFE37|nr:AAA family ATPase [Burkholderia stagnalis]
MEFVRIELENIFAYAGISQIDLAGCNAEQNVIVVSGRNGAGKTSLLNALKLLFLGVNNDSVRRVGFGGTPLHPKHYVMGQPGRWYGVFNSTARGSDVQARVSLEWLHEARRFRAQRTFRRINTTMGFVEELAVSVDGRLLSEDEAATIVSSMAPAEVIPFFFFDGEQVQSFADAEEGRERTEIERLLGLSFVAELTREIDNYSKAKHRAGLPDAVRVEIVRAENAQREAAARAEAASRSRVALEDEIIELRRQRDKIEIERNGLRIGISETDRQRMVGRIEILASQRGNLAREIAEQLPPEAPWLTNLALVRETFLVVDEQLSGGTDASLAQRVHRELPEELVRRLLELTPPVSLNKPQKQAFIDRVAEALTSAGISANASSNPLLASLSPRKIKALRDQYLVWAEKGNNLASAHAEKLRLMRQLTAEQVQAQRDLDESELTTDEARHRFELLTGELEALDGMVRDRSDSAAQARVEEQRALRDGTSALDEIHRLEKEYDDVARENRAYQLSLKVKRALEDYREERRKRIRASVERRLNERVSILLAPSQLIKSVTLDDMFVMKYFDERGDEVARRSISAGMRQLVAMAMLWALKDEANVVLPVMIDTPLGRLDGENRALLMSEYFPKAGNPLILLPTNTEIGSDGFGRLGGRVLRRYEIKNPNGEQARIVDLNNSQRTYE